MNRVPVIVANTPQGRQFIIAAARLVRTVRAREQAQQKQERRGTTRDALS